MEFSRRWQRQGVLIYWQGTPLRLGIRTHSQLAVLFGSLTRCGALLTRATPLSLQILDGHFPLVRIKTYQIAVANFDRYAPSITSRYVIVGAAFTEWLVALQATSLLEKEKEVFDGSNYKARLNAAHPEEGMDQVTAPGQPITDSEEENTSDLEPNAPRSYQVGRAKSPDD